MSEVTLWGLGLRYLLKGHVILEEQPLVDQQFMLHRDLRRRCHPPPQVRHL